MPLSEDTPDLLDGYRTHDPLNDWLEANGISPSRVWQFPDVELRDTPNGGREIVVEGPYRDGVDRGNALFQRIISPRFRVAYPLVVELDPTMLKAYRAARAEYLTNQLITKLGDAGATVIVPKPHDTIMLITATTVPQQVITFMNSYFAETNVRMSVMSNVHTVVHVPAMTPSPEPGFTVLKPMS